MKRYLITCIDDDADFLHSLKGSLPDKVKPLCSEFECVFDFVQDADELREVLGCAGEDGHEPAMLISDQLMPRISGVELIEQVKVDYPDMACVLLTGHAELDSARMAINKRLLDQYACKPIEDIQEFASVVANLLRRRHLELLERAHTEQLAKMVEDLRTSNERIKSMHNIAEQVARLTKNLKHLDFDEITELVTQEVPKIFQAKMGVLCFKEGLPDGCGNGSCVSRCSCPASEEFLQTRDDVEQPIIDLSVTSSPVPGPCEKLGGKSPGVIIPLRLDHVGGNPTDRHAYICMCTMDDPACGEGELVDYMGNLVRDVLGTNLANAALYSIARKQGDTDSLTGIHTRRVFEKQLECEHQRAVRYNRGFSVAIVDVDNFKKVNDAQGHAAGDMVLKGVSDIMRRLVRTADTLARYGGDEFIWLMPETSVGQAQHAVERVRAELRRSAQDMGGPVTVSCGVSQWSGRDTDTAADVVRRADEAMYKAKKAGRDRVEIFKHDED